MEIVYDEKTLHGFTSPARPSSSPAHPVLVDRFLEDAIEIDVDALCDGTEGVHRWRDGAHRGGRDPFR